jgi:fructokinase
MKDPTIGPVVGLGEVLWDCFPDRRLPGGAPANFAFHARQLGLLGVVCSRLGEDALGREYRHYLTAHGLSDEFLQRDSLHDTGRVDVTFERADDPQYTFVENSAWDFLDADERTLDLMRKASAICFGTLAQRSDKSRETIHRCLSAAPANCTIIYDVNLRPPWYARDWIERSLAEASIVKLNNDESRILSDMFSLTPHGDQNDFRTAFAEGLHRRFGLDLVCITCGAQGAFLSAEAGSVFVPAEPIQLADPVGAGDSFTAALYFGKTAGWPLDTIGRFANRFAGLVASQPGAMPQLQEEVQHLLAEISRDEAT